MSKILVTIFMGATLLQCAASGQQQNAYPYLPKASVVAVDSSHVRVDASDPRPLHQALDVLRLTFGWLVDYEDPIYSPTDLIDLTGPVYKAAHPNGPRLLVPRTIPFSATLTKGSANEESAATQRTMLDQLVAAHRQIANPGEFVVNDEGSGRFAVVGISSESSNDSGVLGFTIDLPAFDGSVEDYIQLICQEVHNSTMTKFELGVFPYQRLQTHLVLPKSHIVARKALNDALDATGQLLYSEALYNAGDKSFFLNIRAAVRSRLDVDGREVYQQVTTRAH